MKKKMLALLMAAAMMFSLAACSSGSTTETTTETTTEASTSEDSGSTGVTAKVALITMDQIDTHWVNLEAAAEAEVAELNAAGNNITLTWMAPESKDNAQQIEKIEAAIADGCEYIIIACNDSTSCNSALQEALDAGIKIIYVDSPSTIEGSATFATDNYQGGVQAGEYLLEQLTAAGITEGTIGIVDAQAGVQSCQDRYDGFASVFEGTDFVLGERQYSDGDSSKAQEIANTLIADGVVALYGTNEGSTNGAAAATADAASNGIDVICVGWDKSDTNLTYVENGSLAAFMAQNPDVMGSQAIQAVVTLASGGDLGGETIDTGVSTVTIDNVADFK